MDDPVHVLITLPFDERLVEKLNLVSPRLKIQVTPTNKAEDITAEQWQKAEVFYTNRVLPLPEQAPNLKWIQFHWAGINHAVDAPIMQVRELITTTLSGAGLFPGGRVYPDDAALVGASFAGNRQRGSARQNGRATAVERFSPPRTRAAA